MRMGPEGSSILRDKTTSRTVDLIRSDQTMWFVCHFSGAQSTVTSTATSGTQMPRMERIDSVCFPPLPQQDHTTNSWFDQIGSNNVVCLSLRVGDKIGLEAIR